MNNKMHKYIKRLKAMTELEYLAYSYIEKQKPQSDYAKFAEACKGKKFTYKGQNIHKWELFGLGFRSENVGIIANLRHMKVEAI